MTLGELISRYRSEVEDEALAIRRSWEETFRYATKHFPPETPVADFDVELFAKLLEQSGMHQQFINGYLNRWRGLLEWQRNL